MPDTTVNVVRAGFTGILNLVIAFLFIFEVMAGVEDAVRLMDRGNQQFVRGDYRAALSSYQEAEQSGYSSGALFYNMGNAYFRLDDLGQAIRYYEKAARLLPDDARLEHNLEFARSRTVDRFSQLPEPIWVTARKYLSSGSADDWMFGMGVLLYMLALGMIGYRTWTGIQNAWYRRAWSLSLVAGGILVVSALYVSFTGYAYREGVIVAPSTTLRNEPSDRSPGALDVHEGLVVDMTDRQEDWIQVRIPNGTTGWVEARVVEEI